MFTFWSYDDDSGEDEVIMEGTLLFFLSKFMHNGSLIYYTDKVAINGSFGDVIAPELREWLDEPERIYLRAKIENIFHSALFEFNRYLRADKTILASQAMTEYIMHVVKMRIWMTKADSIVFKLKFC